MATVTSTTVSVLIGVNLMIKSFAIMKKMYRFLFAVAVAATAFVGCVREPEMLPTAEEHPIHFVAQSIETRTAFSEPTGNSYPTLWTANDTKVKVSLNMKQNKDATVTPSPDFTTASFSASFRDTTTYTFYAVSPASAFLNASETAGGELRYRLGVTVPTSQTPSATSVDEAAQILVAQSSTTTGATPPETVSFDFHHWTSYGKMSLTNLNLNGATIEAVDLTAEEDWAYRWYFYFSDGATEVNSGAKTITVNTSSASDIWFACAPVDLTGKKLTVTVKTDQGTFTKKVTIPGKFESGKIYRFSVNMAGVPLVAPKVYQKVTNISALTVDSQVIIAAASDNTHYAMSSVQGTSNRPGSAVTKTEDKIIDPGDAVAVFAVKEGASSGTYAFKAMNGVGDALGYIYASGGTSSNQLKTKSTVDASASWTVTIGTKTVMKAGITGENARNILQYNPNNGSPLFNCYGGNSTSRDSVAIYKLISGQPIIEKQDPNMRITTLSLSLNVGDTGDASVDSIASDYDGDITYTSNNTDVATVDEDGIVTAVAVGTCKITVTASETEHYYSATKECTVTVTDPSNAKTIAFLLSKKPSTEGESTTETYDMNEATVMAISGANVIVKDETGVMLLYKSGTGFEVGDRVTATGKVQNYYGLCEFAATATAKVSSGATVDHGTPVAMDAAAITTFASAPFVQYAKLTGTLPADASAYMKVGTKNVALYVKTMYASYYGMQADVYGYTLGMGGSGQLNFINTSIDANASTPFLTVDATSKTWEADETDAFTVTVSVETGGNWTYTPTGMAWATVTKSGNTLVVTPNSANTTSSANEGTVVVKNSADATKTATITFKQKGVVTGAVVDVLNRALTGVTGTSYTSWSGKKSVSNAVYAGQSAGGNESIQLRSNNSNSGIITTTSGGEVSSIEVTWNSNTDNARILSVYGSNTAYTNPTDLYDSAKQGTWLGEIKKSDNKSLDISGSYKYIGIRSKSGAMYLTEVKITWIPSE